MIDSLNVSDVFRNAFSLFLFLISFFEGGGGGTVVWSQLLWSHKFVEIFILVFLETYHIAKNRQVLGTRH